MEGVVGDAMEFNLTKFPQSAAVQVNSSVPWGMTVQPLREQVKDGTIPRAEDIARCEKCSAYINPLAKLTQGFKDTGGGGFFSWLTGGEEPESVEIWLCPFCAHENVSPERYRECRADVREQLPELGGKFCEGYFGEEQEERCAGITVPVTIIAVDLAADTPEYVSLIKQSVMAVVESLPEMHKVALVGYTDRLRVFALDGNDAHIKHVALVPPHSLQDLLDPITDFPLSSLDGASDATSAEPYFPVSMDDLFSRESVLVTVGEHSESIAFAIEAMESVATEQLRQWEASGRTDRYRRAAGSAYLLLLDYLEASGFVHTGIISIVGGQPDCGLGVRYRGGESYLHAPYFRDLARRAALAGVCIDLYAVDQGSQSAENCGGFKTGMGIEIGMGLLCLLPRKTGGHCMLYQCSANTSTTFSATEPSQLPEYQGKQEEMLTSAAMTQSVRGVFPPLSPRSLPQDLYRHVQSVRGRNGLLRIRTSRDFRVSSSYGNIIEDSVEEGLYYVTSCSDETRLPFQFQFTKQSASLGKHRSPPIVQVAYTFVVIYEKEIDGEYQCEGRSDGGVSVATVHGEHLNKTEQEEAGNVREDDEGGRGPRKALYMSRRIRIMTRKLPVAVSPRFIFTGMDVEETLSLILHQVLDMCLVEGEPLSRIPDTILETFASQVLAYNQDKLMLEIIAQQDVHKIDTSFGRFRNLNLYPRFMFALYHFFALLRDLEARGQANSGEWLAMLQVALGYLSSSSIRQLLYPTLSSYGSHDVLREPFLVLSSECLTPTLIHIIDSYFQILVYYNARVPNEFACQPPSGTVTHGMLGKARAARYISPSIIYVHQKRKIAQGGAGEREAVEGGKAVGGAEGDGEDGKGKEKKVEKQEDEMFCSSSTHPEQVLQQMIEDRNNLQLLEGRAHDDQIPGQQDHESDCEARGSAPRIICDLSSFLETAAERALEQAKAAATAWG